MGADKDLAGDRVVVGGWIVANVLSRVALALVQGENPTAESLIRADLWIIANDAVTVGTAVLAILIVRSVRDRRSKLPVAPPEGDRPPPPRPDLPEPGPTTGL